MITHITVAKLVTQSWSVNCSPNTNPDWPGPPVSNEMHCLVLANSVCLYLSRSLCLFSICFPFSSSPHLLTLSSISLCFLMFLSIVMIISQSVILCFSFSVSLYVVLCVFLLFSSLCSSLSPSSYSIIIVINYSLSCASVSSICYLLGHFYKHNHSAFTH